MRPWNIAGIIFLLSFFIFSAGCKKDDEIDMRDSKWVCYCNETNPVPVCDALFADSLKPRYYMHGFIINETANSLQAYEPGYYRDTTGQLGLGVKWNELVTAGELIVDDDYVGIGSSGSITILFYYEISGEKLRIYATDTSSAYLFHAPFEFSYRNVKEIPANGPNLREF